MPTDPALFDEERTMVTMSLGDHIEDLRHHLIWALLGLFAGVVVTLIPPLNLGRLVVRQLQEPAQRSLVAFHARQATERAARRRGRGLVIRRSPRGYRLERLLDAIRQVFPSCPLRHPTALEGRYVELPQELRDSGLHRGLRTRPRTKR